MKNEKVNIAMLTGSSHPELKEIANALTAAGKDFYFVSGLVFTLKESSLIKKFFPQNSKFQAFVSDRTVNSSKPLLLRPMLLFEVLYLAFFYFPHSIKSNFVINLLDEIDKASKIRGEKLILKLLREGNIKTLIAQNSFNLTKIPLGINFVEIAYHGLKDNERFWHKFASQQWPDWQDTWRVANSDSKNDSPFQTNRKDSPVRSRYVVVSSSFSVTPVVDQNVHYLTIPLGQKDFHRYSIHNPIQSIGKSFIFLGSLGLRKGIPLLLEASRHLEKDSRLKILGRADKYVADQLLKQKNDKIEVIFNPNREYVLQALEKSDAFLFPSYYEGFGIAILEAMASGCIPVVSRNTCGPDILAGTVFEEFLFDAGNIAQFLTAIKKIEKMPTIQLIKLKKVAQKIASKYTFKKFGENCVFELKNLNLI